MQLSKKKVLMWKNHKDKFSDKQSKLGKKVHSMIPIVFFQGIIHIHVWIWKHRKGNKKTWSNLLAEMNSKKRTGGRKGFSRFSLYKILYCLNLLYKEYIYNFKCVFKRRKIFK